MYIFNRLADYANSIWKKPPENATTSQETDHSNLTSKEASSSTNKVSQHTTKSPSNSTLQSFEKIIANKEAIDIALLRGKYEQGWSTELFSQHHKLESLEFNNPLGHPPAPQDKFSGLVALKSLKRLDLIRCEFMDKDCYVNLGKMHQLETLDLTRTVTNEKAPGEKTDKHLPDGRVIKNLAHGLDDCVMDALRSLLKHGNLTNLNIRGCSAFTDNDVKELRDLVANKNGSFMFSANNRETQVIGEPWGKKRHEGCLYNYAGIQTEMK